MDLVIPAKRMLELSKKKGFINRILIGDNDAFLRFFQSIFSKIEKISKVPKISEVDKYHFGKSLVRLETLFEDCKSSLAAGKAYEISIGEIDKMLKPPAGYDARLKIQKILEGRNGKKNKESKKDRGNKDSKDPVRS